ncbi:MAG: quinolinate synthase NadA [Planctomycetaceae bacterium]|nr:quinolinate synthase NadA [Planctomycetaceae bacterium]
MPDGRRTGTTARAYTVVMMRLKTPTNEPLAAGPLDAYRKLDDAVLARRIDEVRQRLGSRVLILGHHYQQDGVIAHADLRGDSYQLSKSAAERTDCEAIVFCGVHFMAETADILVNRPEQIAERGGVRVDVVLPDTAAGCSMADMAAIEQVEDAWADLGEIIDTNDITPVTYINSAASLKAFCGQHGGIVCTSSNARAVLEWAFAKTKRVLFFPDQHLGRNTAKAMGVPLEQMCVWNPHDPRLGGNDETTLKNSRVILWQGHCSVHAMFRPEHVDTMRKSIPGIKVLVHPECAMEVVEKADLAGSTSYIINQVEAAPAGSSWAIGTELHLVRRLEQEHPEQAIRFLSPTVCMCATMYRIDLAHLCWSLEHLESGDPVNVIRVEEQTAHWSVVALERMLDVTASK